MDHKLVTNARSYRGPDANSDDIMVKARPKQWTPLN